jgi:hypothetical protein
LSSSHGLTDVNETDATDANIVQKDSSQAISYDDFQTEIRYFAPEAKSLHYSSLLLSTVADNVSAVCSAFLAAAKREHIHLADDMKSTCSNFSQLADIVHLISHKCDAHICFTVHFDEIGGKRSPIAREVIDGIHEFWVTIYNKIQQSPSPRSCPRVYFILTGANVDLLPGPAMQSPSTWVYLPLSSFTEPQVERYVKSMKRDESIANTCKIQESRLSPYLQSQLSSTLWRWSAGMPRFVVHCYATLAMFPKLNWVECENDIESLFAVVFHHLTTTSLRNHFVGLNNLDSDSIAEFICLLHVAETKPFLGRLPIALDMEFGKKSCKTPLRRLQRKLPVYFMSQPDQSSYSVKLVIPRLFRRYLEDHSPVLSLQFFSDVSHQRSRADVLERLAIYSVVYHRFRHAGTSPVLSDVLPFLTARAGDCPWTDPALPEVSAWFFVFLPKFISTQASCTVPRKSSSTDVWRTFCRNTVQVSPANGQQITCALPPGAMYTARDKSAYGDGGFIPSDDLEVIIQLKSGQQTLTAGMLREEIFKVCNGCNPTTEGRPQRQVKAGSTVGKAKAPLVTQTKRSRRILLVVLAESCKEV